MIQQSLDGVSICRWLLGFCVRNYWETQHIKEQTLKLWATIGIELLLEISRGYPLLLVLGVLFVGPFLSHDGLKLQSDRTVLNDTESIVVHLADHAIYFLGSLHINGQTSQLHLHNVDGIRLEVIEIDRLLLVTHHQRVVLLVDVPSRQSIYQVVTKQYIQWDITDVLDVFTHGVVTSELLGLGFQTQLITGTGVGRQIGDQLGAIEVPHHHVQTFLHTINVTNVIHEQLIDQYGHVEGDVVVNLLLQVTDEEVLQQSPDSFVLHLDPIRCFFGPRDRLVVNRKGNAFMLTPTEGDGAYP